MAADIYFLDIDETNETKLARHAVAVKEVLEMLGNRHVTRQNPKGPQGRIQLIGRTNGGRALTVMLDPTDEPATWRPVTGWDAEVPEKTLLDRNT